MSEYTTRDHTSNQLTVQYDRSIVFIGSNEFKQMTYASQGADTSLPMGTVMGRVNATGEVVELKSAADDGSQYPYGILASGMDITAGDQPTLSICVAGEVNAGKVSFDGSDTVATVVDGRRLDDRIASDTVGIVLVETTELSQADN